MPVATIKQAEFLALPHKIRAFVAGFGSGKTYVGCIDLCKFAIENPRVNQAYFAPSYPQIRDIFYPTIDEVAHSFGFAADIKETNKEVHLLHGNYRYSTIKCRSLDKPHSIVGFNVGNAMVDEVDIIPLDKALIAFNKIIARLRWPGAKNSLFFTSTPEGFNFIYKKFVSEIREKPELANLYGMVQASTYDNEVNLPPDYIDTLLRSYPAELITSYIDGQFVNLKAGTVYYAFNRKRHLSREIIAPGEPLHIGMDFNVGKMAAKIFVIRGEAWHCLGEIVDAYDTPAMIDIIGQRYPGHSITIYPDSSGAGRSTNDASTSDIAMLQGRYTVKFRPSNPLIKDRVMAVNKRFQDGQLFVSPSCIKTIDDLEQQAYDRNGMPDKQAGNDHGNDAFGYPIAYMFPIRKPILNINASFVS